MEDVKIERLKEYTDDDVNQLGRLMMCLSERFDGSPINKDLLEAIISSPNHEQLVARLKRRIIGAATLSIVMGVGAGRQGYLEDFVVDQEARGNGVADSIWNEIINWCKENEVDLNFTSKLSRFEAHRFYKKHGAEIKDTDVFEVKIKK